MFQPSAVQVSSSGATSSSLWNFEVLFLIQYLWPPCYVEKIRSPPEKQQQQLKQEQLMQKQPPYQSSPLQNANVNLQLRKGWTEWLELESSKDGHTLLQGDQPQMH